MKIADVEAAYMCSRHVKQRCDSGQDASAGGRRAGGSLSDRLSKLKGSLLREEVDNVLLCSAESLRYFCSYSSPIETGPSPFTPLSGALLWTCGGLPVFFLADMECAEEVPGVEREAFISYTVERPLGAMEDLAARIVARMGRVGSGQLGIEANQLPVALLDRLRFACPGLKVRDVTALLSEIRMIKDEAEIESIRHAVALCDIGQKAAKETLRPGIREIELFEEVRFRMETIAGERLPLLADLVSGPRTAQAGGSPSSRVIGAGECVIVDLAPRSKGYWGDSCNTLVAGDPTAQQKKVFTDVSCALAEVIAGTRPGVLACELDSGLRKSLAPLGGVFPHHGGHGLGVAYHEEPRVVPYNRTPIQANMVIALEPGVYFPGQWGMRLEYVVHVTETGAELLTGFPHLL